LPAVNRNAVSYFLTKPDKAVALFAARKVAVWRPLITFHRRLISYNDFQKAAIRTLVSNTAPILQLLRYNALQHQANQV
jgi:hypothetical protein